MYVAGGEIFKLKQTEQQFHIIIKFQKYINRFSLNFQNCYTTCASNL